MIESSEPWWYSINRIIIISSHESSESIRKNSPSSVVIFSFRVFFPCMRLLMMLCGLAHKKIDVLHETVGTHFFSLKKRQNDRQCAWATQINLHHQQCWWDVDIPSANGTQLILVCLSEVWVDAVNGGRCKHRNLRCWQSQKLVCDCMSICKREREVDWRQFRKTLIIFPLLCTHIIRFMCVRVCADASMCRKPSCRSHTLIFYLSSYVRLI